MAYFRPRHAKSKHKTNSSFHQEDAICSTSVKRMIRDEGRRKERRLREVVRVPKARQLARDIDGNDNLRENNTKDAYLVDRDTYNDIDEAKKMSGMKTFL